MFYVFCHGSCASWDYRPHLWPKLTAAHSTNHGTAAHQLSQVGAPIETTSNTYNGEIKYYQSQLHCDFDNNSNNNNNDNNNNNSNDNNNLI